MATINPFRPILEQDRPVILDGGTATELEALGHDLSNPLWSAKLLATAPEAIRSVHRQYWEAGADCLITTSYQASLPGLLKRGYTEVEAEALLLKSVELTCFSPRKSRPLSPIVAASIGPYGAYLADGSEYTGNYGLTRSQLREFHSGRWQILSDSPAHLLACETLPDLKEAEVLLDLLASTPETWAWFTFTCRNAHQISDGTPFREVVHLLKDAPRVAGIGVNCTPPEVITPLIRIAKEEGLETPFIAYPNSGEVFDGHRRCWTGKVTVGNWVSWAWEWWEAGAGVIGGCCRTRPEHIRALCNEF